METHNFLISLLALIDSILKSLRNPDHLEVRIVNNLFSMLYAHILRCELIGGGLGGGGGGEGEGFKNFLNK
jgi:hypothetical protein